MGKVLIETECPRQLPIFDLIESLNCLLYFKTNRLINLLTEQITEKVKNDKLTVK